MYNSFNNPGLVKVLRFLQTHNTEYLSGQDLSDVLKISRVAVWKHIKKIQELGYVVESKQKLGYKLVSNSKLLLPWEITSNLKTQFIGRRAYYFDEIDSTQTRALEMLKEDAINGTIIVAKTQTSGLGRTKRRWISPKGGIWISIILHPKFNVSITTLFPIASSLALSIAIEKTFSIKPELKWPNDLTIRGKKIAGILVDALIESNEIKGLVLGVGINFDVNTKHIEKLLGDTPNFYGISSLEGQKQNIRPVQLLQNFLAELEEICSLLDANQIKNIVSEWTSRSSTIGKQVKLDTADSKVKGEAIRIEDDGALVISENNKEHKIIAGDIIYLS